MILKKWRGFTVVETLIVAAIIAIIAALLYPVILRAKISGKQSNSLAKLKQLHLIAKLYQADYGGSGVYGEPSQAGLPVYGPEPGLGLMYAFKPYGFTPQLVLSPCGCQPTNVCSDEHQIDLAWAYRWWRTESPRYQELTPLFWDLNCNDLSVNLRNPVVSKFGAAVLLGGSVRQRRSSGDPFGIEFFVNESEIR